ncbi:hypothetical protein FB45DRAFT_962888 [Roridomyces roridus]|uniref:CxC1-like cysteine cluster associated with KDZ transposases domain-containing protein n=1 Tax=Roridomyces roridus TaxID=1738132 RepID=A0AAD7AXS6_9AGAR|nr:hypothetical protein FB45DRAFT_962888 [Roridomyces roridus]
MDISNAGEELPGSERADFSLVDELRENYHRTSRRRRDYRTRSDRTQKMVDAFALQLDAMTDAYMEWDLTSIDTGPTYEPTEGAVIQNTQKVFVVDVFDANDRLVLFIEGDAFIASSFLRHGIMPVSALNPEVAITIRALELFRTARLRCPRLGAQAFARTLCDLHGVAPRPHLQTQLAVAFDVYTAIHEKVCVRVQQALGRDTPDWRLKNACPSCMYRLEGEPSLELPLLFTMDGNNSLKRFHRREREVINEDGSTVPGASKERMDNRDVTSDYYLSPEAVDKWAKDGMEEAMKGFVPDSDWDEESDGCAERWQNMKEEVTARAWGLYEETGIFISLCRHGFVLLVCDMIKSGELAKYGFAVVFHLLKALGEIASGYDIGCKFGKMVRSHPKLGPLARESKYKSLIGAFHGLGHNRLCQASNLTKYIRGVGLEVLELCEAWFSKSNALASSTRYASRFHRKQAVVNYIKHADTFDAYAGLSSLLCSKYHRALDVQKTWPVLQESMASLDVADRSEFEAWLVEERECLKNLSREPPEETLKMEYYQKLVNLREHEANLILIMGMDMPMVMVDGSDGYEASVQQTRRVETLRRHAQELRDKSLATVHDLELRLGVTQTWVPGDAEWVAAAELVSERRYRRALDQVQKLVISRMFELTRVNMAGTAYKLRKHIAKSLQVRSKALKNALARYNTAAESMVPARPTLTWDQVADYAFLADFDLLRLGREDIREKKWAAPAARVAMDEHFKLLRAEEEITRLNVEIRRFVTYMRDEEGFLIHRKAVLEESGERALAHQVSRLRMLQGRFNAGHKKRLAKLSRDPGFSGSVVPGISVSKERHVATSPPSADSLNTAREGAEQHDPPEQLRHAGAGEEDDDETDDEGISGLADAFDQILDITRDDGQRTVDVLDTPHTL